MVTRKIEPSIHRGTWQTGIGSLHLEIPRVYQMHLEPLSFQVALQILWVYQVHHLVEQLKCLNSDDCVLE